MVGWTNVKPENIQGGSSLSKAELTKLYEEAIDEFYSPVDRYFTEALGINPSDILKQVLTHPAQRALAAAMWNDLLRNGFKP